MDLVAEVNLVLVKLTCFVDINRVPKVRLRARLSVPLFTTMFLQGRSVFQ